MGQRYDAAMSAPAMRFDERNRDRAIRADDRLLAEMMLAQLRVGGTDINDQNADDAARTASGDLETRLVVRARVVKNAGELTEALRHVRHVLWLLVAIGLFLALIAGVATAQAVMSTARHESVNFFLVFGSLLGVQTTLLLIWLGLLLFARGSARVSMTAASLGGLIMALARRIIHWTHHGAEHTAAVSALSTMMMRSSIGKWSISAISNGLWLAFNVGAMVVIVALLSARQYAFVWETTILSEKVYVPLTRAIAWLPATMGFVTPTPEQIVASQFIAAEGAASQPSSQIVAASKAWSGLLVGSIVVYGFGPRLLLLGLSLGRRRAARSKYRIDLSRPEVLQLRDRLEPPASRLAVIDDSNVLPRTVSTRGMTDARPKRPIGSPAIVGVELAQPPHRWPPSIPGGKSWNDLGMVDRREDRQRVMQTLRTSQSQPGAMVIVCELSTTPDRGLGHFLTDVASVVESKIWLILTGGQQMRDRGEGGDIAQRVDDWRALAVSAGMPVDRVVELDLDHLTHTTLGVLASIVPPGGGGGPTNAAPAHARRLEQAFCLIVEFTRRCQAHPDSIRHEDQATLHQQIASLYRDEETSWRNLLRVPASIQSTMAAGFSAQMPGELASSLKSSAQRFASFLPDRLKRSPKWLAAGAAAGALGCLAAAALISPVAIGALPMWSVIGAAIAAVVQSSRTTTNQDAQESASQQFSDAVRAAALFALILELQGRDERTITRVLDQAIPEAAMNADIAHAADVERWLNDVHHHLDMALAREAVR